MLTLPAYAKINLTLEILGKRPDGYHEIATVLQTIDLADILSFQPSKQTRLVCHPEGLEAPKGLILKTAALLREITGCEEGALIHLTQGVPKVSGLGSTASDAATTLRGLNEFWGLALPHSKLLELASRLGSDVPFFLYGGTALARGRGERVTPLSPLPETWIVLIRPKIEIPPDKTRTLYAKVKSSHFTQGQFTERFIALLRRGGEVEPSTLFNAFEGIALDTFPGLYDYRQRFLGAGAEAVHLAGAGPALFTLAADEARAEALQHHLSHQGIEEVYLAKTIGSYLAQSPS